MRCELQYLLSGHLSSGGLSKKGYSLRFIFPIFFVTTLVEMWLLIRVGSAFGAFATIVLVFVTAAVGVSLLRRQGVSTLARVQDRLRSGQVPARELAEGMFLAVGGALLLAPGFLTDALGFCCLLPGVRNILLSRAVNLLFAKHASAVASAGMADPSDASRANASAEASSTADTSRSSSEIIEGEYKREQ